MIRPGILIQNPLRRPQWRLDRVMEMMRHRPQPLRPHRGDDHPVRAYRCVLIELAAAGANIERRDAVFREFPAMCHAHLLHYSPDVENRQILEARLLTDESFAEIAHRFATKPDAIKYYEEIFFNVRDRMQSRDWIWKVIRGSFRETRYERASDAQRGYILRLFAYYGGPLVLDAVINGMRAKVPQRAEDVRGWFEDTLGHLVRSSAAAAASVVEMNQKNMMKLIKLAVKAGAASAKARSEGPSLSFDEMTERMAGAIDWTLIRGAPAKVDEAQQKDGTSAPGPRTDAQLQPNP